MQRRLGLTGVDLSELVLQSLANERAIDLRYRESSDLLSQTDTIPNYKVMKQLALRRRLKLLYPLFIACAPLVVIGLMPIQWLFSMLGGVRSQRPNRNKLCCRIVATTSQNAGLIESALGADSSIENIPLTKVELTSVALGRRLGLRAVLVCIRAHFHLLIMLAKLPQGERRDLIFHACDSFQLLLLAYDVSLSKDVFVTDDHYQRWAFVLSHVAADFRIVQHGFVDTAQRFPHAFGLIQTLYLRDPGFLEQFELFYSVTTSRVFSPEATFVHTDVSDRAVFLASSFPAIDAELELLERVRAGLSVPIMVKFHPAHEYDARKSRLADLADFVFEEGGNPDCRVFVSYNSFMEFDYRSQGVPTISIARSGGVGEAYTRLTRLVSASCANS